LGEPVGQGRGMSENGLALDDSDLEEERFAHRPLVGAMSRVQSCMAGFKERVRAYYFEVVLSPHPCPGCGGRLKMTGQSLCSCSCGRTFDPTLEFQRSACCCGARLVRRTFHYACSKCQEVVPSRFIFDERVFDSAYFREMMRESRERGRKRKEEIGRLLMEARSGALPLLEQPNLESINGLLQDLDLFVQHGSEDVLPCGFEPKQEFSMARYRDHILARLGWGAVSFSGIPAMGEESRQDRAWRFITLVFMQNERVVDLVQEGDNIWVQRLQNEAHA
jgi:hypothetical protein